MEIICSCRGLCRVNSAFLWSCEGLQMHVRGCPNREGCEIPNPFMGLRHLRQMRHLFYRVSPKILKSVPNHTTTTLHLFFSTVFRILPTGRSKYCLMCLMCLNYCLKHSMSDDLNRCQRMATFGKTYAHKVLCGVRRIPMTPKTNPRAVKDNYLDVREHRYMHGLVMIPKGQLVDCGCAFLQRIHSPFIIPQPCACRLKGIRVG
jgi:hypothetical protein